MDEAQRIAYLKHMGVEQYYPRYVLVGAKESVIPAAAQDIYDSQGSQQLPARHDRQSRRAVSLMQSPDLTPASVTERLLQKR